MISPPLFFTHEKVLLDCDAEFKEFAETMDVLSNKLGPLLLQFGYFNKTVFRGVNDFLERAPTVSLKKLPKALSCDATRLAGQLPQSQRIRKFFHLRTSLAPFFLRINEDTPASWTSCLTGSIPESGNEAIRNGAPVTHPKYR